jgi:hypothetical protein
MASKPAILKRKKHQPRKRPLPEISCSDDYDPIEHASNIDEHIEAFDAKLATTAAGVEDFVASTNTLDTQIDGFLTSTTDPTLVALLKKCKRYGPMGALLLKDVRDLQDKSAHFSTDLDLIRSSVYQHVLANVQSDFELKAHYQAEAVRVPPKIPTKKIPNPALMPSQTR